MDTILIVWIALAVVFAVIEAATAQIVTIWFTVGAVGAIVAKLLNTSVLVQFLVFVALSVLTLVIARPFLVKFTRTKTQPTNLDMCIGQDALVLEEINNTKGTGQAKIRGNVWTARSKNDSIIPKDTIVTVDAIDGVKLIVFQKEQEVNS